MQTAWHALMLMVCAMMAATAALPTSAAERIGGAKPMATAPANSRALWIWEPASWQLLADARQARDAIAFLRQQHITIVYLYAGAYQGLDRIAVRPDDYRRLIRALHRANIHAYALLGSAYLHTEEYVLPARRAEAHAAFQRVLDYNAASARAARFDGVSLDIEPHLLAAWDTRKLELLGQFLDLGAELMALKRASHQSLPVGAAIPFWFDGISLDWHGTAQPVSEHAQDTLDYVALMDYRNHAQGGDGLIAHAQTEMDYAGKIGKRVVVGVEVSPSELAKVTFDGLTEVDLERELAATARAFANAPAFAGFAIHHYRSYRQWLARPAATAAPP